MKLVTKGINLIKSIGWNILIPAPKDEALNKLDPEAEYIVEIKKKVKRRSLNANAYAWVLCEKIAHETHTFQKMTCISVLFKKLAPLHIYQLKTMP